MPALDEARRRWGSARSIQGGGQGSPRIDLSPWRGFAIDRGEEVTTGIADSHFDAFGHVARREECIILVRQGKFACVAWIKKDYPAKPGSIWKIKNSKTTGLVTCAEGLIYSCQEQRQHAWDAGYYVLEEVPGKPYLHARRRDQFLPDRTGAPQPFPANAHEAGQVIDPHCRLPLTGDYDLMGVIPMDGPRSKTLVLVWSQADDEKAMEVTFGVFLRKDRNNPYCKRIARELNAAFGGRPRILHGAHDLKFDPSENHEGGCTVFSPELAFFLPTPEAVEEFYIQIGRCLRNQQSGKLDGLPRPERSV